MRMMTKLLTKERTIAVLAIQIPLRKSKRGAAKEAPLGVEAIPIAVPAETAVTVADHRRSIINMTFIRTTATKEIVVACAIVLAVVTVAGSAGGGGVG